MSCQNPLTASAPTLPLMFYALKVDPRLYPETSCQPKQDLVQEVLSHLEVLSQHVALAVVDVLARMTGGKVLDLMGKDLVYA